MLFHNSLESRNVDSFPTFSNFWICNYLLRSLGSEMIFWPITKLQAVGFWSWTLSIWSMHPRKSAVKHHVRFSWGIYPFMLYCIVCLGKQFSPLSHFKFLKSLMDPDTVYFYIRSFRLFPMQHISKAMREKVKEVPYWS